MILAPTVLPESPKSELQEHRPVRTDHDRSDETARAGQPELRSAFALLLDAAAGSGTAETPGTADGVPVRGEVVASGRNTIRERAGLRLPGEADGKRAAEMPEDAGTDSRSASVSAGRTGTAGSGNTRGGTFRGASLAAKGAGGGPDDADDTADREPGTVKKAGRTGASDSEAELVSAAGIAARSQTQEARPAGIRSAGYQAAFGVVSGGPAELSGEAGETVSAGKTGEKSGLSVRRANRAGSGNGTGKVSAERDGPGEESDRSGMKAETVAEGRTVRSAANRARAGSDETGRKSGGADAAKQDGHEERFGTVKDGPVTLEVIDVRTDAAAGTGEERPDSGWNDRDALRELESVGTESGAARSGHISQTARTVSDAPAAGHSAALLRQLREETNAEIVKNARIVLHDDERGEIRLRLKPEQLGSVRIELYLEEDRIAGRIFVENDTVREAFEENLRYLQQAFAQEGFTTGNLDVSVENGNREDRQRPEQPHGRSRVRELERHVAGAVISHEGYLNLIV